MTSQPPPNLQQQALVAVLRDLPKLWESHPGQFVAYGGGNCLGISRSKHLMYKECLDRGLQHQEFVVFCIEPQETDLILNPVVLD